MRKEMSPSKVKNNDLEKWLFALFIARQKVEDVERNINNNNRYQYL